MESHKTGPEGTDAVIYTISNLQLGPVLPKQVLAAISLTYS